LGVLYVPAWNPAYYWWSRFVPPLAARLVTGEVDRGWRRHQAVCVCVLWLLSVAVFDANVTESYLFNIIQGVITPFGCGLTVWNLAASAGS